MPAPVPPMPLPRDEKESRAVGPKETLLLPVCAGTAARIVRRDIEGRGGEDEERRRLLLTIQ